MMIISCPVPSLNCNDMSAETDLVDGLRYTRWMHVRKYWSRIARLCAPALKVTLLACAVAGTIWAAPAAQKSA